MTSRILLFLSVGILALAYCYYGFLLIVFGIANVFTSLLFYSTLGAVLGIGTLWAGKTLRLSKGRRVDLVLLLFALTSCLAVGDLYLRYGLARYRSYNEKWWSSHYTTQYRSALSLGLAGVTAGSGGPSALPRNRRFVRRQPEFSYDDFNNSEGLRDRDHPKAKPAGEFRIIGLGDSFTQGLGAPFAETWPQQLVRILREKAAARQAIDIMSGGISGSDPYFEYMLLKNHLLEYAPDLVIVAINASDIGDCIVRGGMERFRKDGSVVYRKGPSWEWIYACSYIFRHIVHDFMGHGRDLLRQEERDARTVEALDLIQASLGYFSSLAEQHDFRLLVVFNPLSQEVVARKSPFERVIERLRRESQIEVLDLLEYYTAHEGMNERNIDDYYWKIDRHHTPKGYRVFAEGVAKRLLQLGWLQRNEGPVSGCL